MWLGDKFIYTSKTLKLIATHYWQLYGGLDFGDFTETKLFSLAEYKADFDLALRAIGKGHWTGDMTDCQFKDFRYFGKLQKAIIADIYGMPLLDNRLRGYAYYRMRTFLNGEIYDQEN